MTTKRSAGLLLVVFVVVFCSVGSRDVSKSRQHKRSLNPPITNLKANTDAKTVRYNFYGGKKRMFLPTDNIDTKKLLSETQLLSKRNRKQRKNFQKKSKSFMHAKTRNNRPKANNGHQTQWWKSSIENAFRKDNLVNLLQVLDKNNTSQFKINNNTGISLRNESEKIKPENPKVWLHEVLENADQKQSSEKIAAEEIKLGFGKIVSQLKKVLKQDSDFLKNTTKPVKTKPVKIDLKKLIADMKASQNKNSQGKSNEEDDSIALSPQQKLKVSDLHISKDLNLKDKSGEKNGGQGMEITPMNGMNVMNGMNGMNDMNGINGMNPMIGMNAMNGMNRMNQMNRMNGMAFPNNMNGMNGMGAMNNFPVTNGFNGMNAMNPMNPMNPMNGMNRMNPMNKMNGMAFPNSMNGMNGMGAMNDFPVTNGMNPMNANPAAFMNNLPRMSDLDSDLPDRTQIQKIMYSRFHGDQTDPNSWPSDSKASNRLPLESYQDEQDDQEEQDEPEEPSQYHYSRHREHYNSPYDDEIAEDVRGIAQRYRDEEEDEEDVDRAQLREYENANERATITRHVHLKKHRFHHDPTKKKSMIKHPDHTGTKVVNIKASDRKGHQKPGTRGAAAAKRTFSKKQ